MQSFQLRPQINIVGVLDLEGVKLGGCKHETGKLEYSCHTFRRLAYNIRKDGGVRISHNYKQKIAKI